jgi:DNA invertase Pin-like site-specific DNA recombinase
VIGQSPVPQINTLIQAGVPEAGIYLERAGGYKTAWPERDLLLASLRRGDTVKITRLDRLFYSIQNLVVLGTDLRERGVRLHAIEQDIDSESLDGRDLFGMLSALADLHRDFVLSTTNDGLATARARGKTGGRRPLLSAEQADQALQLYGSGTPVARLARQFNVSRGTIYRYISLANPEQPQQATPSETAASNST